MATTTVAPPAPEAQPALSGISRIFGVFFSPKPTFEDIVRKPTWIAPVILITVLSLVVCVVLNQRMNWRDYVSQQIDKNPRAAQLSAEQKEQQIEAGAKYAPIFTYAFGVPAPVVFVLVLSLVMWGAYSLLGGISTNFVTALGIIAHASLVSVVSTILFLVILFLKPPGTIDLDNPVAANAAAFLSEDSAKWLVTLFKQFDIFTFWTLILIGIGFAAINPRKLKAGKAISIGFALWAAYVVVRTGIAFVFS
ncbi:MAG: hypothetical protein C5B56_14345 [Proteobacteria bacterium]|nr:MAG: hypothetical protein C5B56_14345 [Pseudomonadota bacterium]